MANTSPIYGLGCAGCGNLRWLAVFVMGLRFDGQHVEYFSTRLLL